MMEHQSQRAARLKGSDHLRGYSAGRDLLHKEWMHFCVFHEDINLLINFSWFADAGGIACRLMVVIEGATGSNSAVVRFAPEQCSYRPGATDFCMGKNSVRLAGIGYELKLDVPEIKLKVHLYLVAQTQPSMTPQTRLGGDANWIRWLVVPRLAARGSVTIENTTTPFSNVPGYHDHNWGAFRWGDDFGWLWCIMLPKDPKSPWALVVSRVTDSAGNQFVSQNIPIWRGDALHRLFLANQITTYRAKTPTPIQQCIPKQASLLIPEEHGQTSLTRIEAIAGCDRVKIDLAEGLATRIVVPSETDPTRVATISEHFLTAKVDGVVRGEEFGWDGPCLVEQTGGYSLC